MKTVKLINKLQISFRMVKIKTIERQSKSTQFLLQKTIQLRKCVLHFLHIKIKSRVNIKQIDINVNVSLFVQISIANIAGTTATLFCAKHYCKSKNLKSLKFLSYHFF